MPLLKKILFGSKTFSSELESDKFLLAGYFLLMYICIDVFFLIINLFNPNADNGPIFMGMFISSGCLFLLRKGWHNTAIIIQLVRSNYIAFYFTYVDVGMTGNFFFFIVNGIGSLALFGYEERWKGIGFAGISLALFYISVFRRQDFTPDNPHLFLVMNFTITYLMSFVIIYFLNQLTYLSRMKEIEKNRQLEKVNAELDRFVYSVSHDLRAPLSSISGLIHLTERTSEKKETEQYLTLMKGRIERLEVFIRDIINFSRNARSEIKTETVNLKELADEIFETLKFINGADSIDMENELLSTLVTTIDKARLQIVLFNLISNAIQYRDTYKSRSYIKISSTERDGCLILNLDDNGIGIDPQHHAKVYNMFYRASENSKGSGLGLYIAKETMDKLGGTISLQSVLGQGTRFSLEWPLQRQWKTSTSEN